MAEQAPNTTQKRLRILGDDEIEALYGREHSVILTSHR
jgi:hypothetical protein